MTTASYIFSGVMTSATTVIYASGCMLHQVWQSTHQRSSNCT